jgi:hypothetical protein
MSLPEHEIVVKQKRSIDLQDVPVASSGSYPMNAINNIIKWTVYKTRHLLSYFALPLAHSNVVSAKCISGSSSGLGVPASYGFDTKSTLLLLDTVVRKFTKAKPMYVHDDSDGISDALAVALNIVQECEDHLRLALVDNLNLDVEIDFVELHNAVYAKVNQLDDIQNIKQIRADALNIIDNYINGKGLF